MTKELLATLEDFAASRGATFDPTDVAALIALEGASSAVRTQTGRTFDLVRDDTIRLSGHGTDTLFLPQPPVLSVTSVSLLGWSSIVDPLELDPDTDYTLEDADLGTVLRLPVCDYWPRGRMNIEVTYDHGWLMPGADEETLTPEQVPAEILPADLSVLVMAVAGRGYQLSSNAGQVVSSAARTIGKYSEQTSYSVEAAGASAGGGFTDLELGVLASYQLVGFED